MQSESEDIIFRMSSQIRALNIEAGNGLKCPVEAHSNTFPFLGHYSNVTTSFLYLKYIYLQIKTS